MEAYDFDLKTGPHGGRRTSSRLDECSSWAGAAADDEGLLSADYPARHTARSSAMRRPSANGRGTEYSVEVEVEVELVANDEPVEVTLSSTERYRGNDFGLRGDYPRRLKSGGRWVDSADCRPSGRGFSRGSRPGPSPTRGPSATTVPPTRRSRSASTPRRARS